LSHIPSVDRFLFRNYTPIQRQIATRQNSFGFITSTTEKCPKMKSELNEFIAKMKASGATQELAEKRFPVKDLPNIRLLHSNR